MRSEWYLFYAQHHSNHKQLIPANVYKFSTTTRFHQQQLDFINNYKTSSYPPEVPVPWRWQLNYVVETVHELAHPDGKERTYIILQTRREYEVEAVLDLTAPRRVQHCKIVGFLDVASLDPTAALQCRSLSSCSNMGLY